MLGRHQLIRILRIVGLARPELVKLRSCVMQLILQANNVLPQLFNLHRNCQPGDQQAMMAGRLRQEACAIRSKV